ncbi:hypothetical protein Fot_41654 [Forsythia ovata]|uniref:Uncharacterized protein n=1 Tax=Forsythia ovata TaxID=205694 RepID=A0ABD1RKC2_9LAMI
MVLHLLSMMMEVMGGTVDTPRLGDEAEGAVSMVVGGKDTTVCRWILSATVKATIKNHPFEVVAVGGELAAGVVDSRLMGQMANPCYSWSCLDIRIWSKEDIIFCELIIVCSILTFSAVVTDINCRLISM